MENILLDAKKSLGIKLTEFGTAVKREKFNNGTKEILSEVAGTPYYVAPEVLQSEYDHKCDIWSIGVIAYMLLAGRPPFNGENELEIVKSVRDFNLNMNIPQLENVSPEAKDFVSKLLEYDPQQRPEANKALEHNWIKLYDQSDKDIEITC